MESRLWANQKKSLTDAHPPCVKVLFESVSGLDRYSAHFESLSFVSASVVLGFYLQNVMRRGYCCSGWAVSLLLLVLTSCGHTPDSWFMGNLH